VAAHSLKPSAALLKRATAAIDRILGDNSELREEWNEADGWLKAIGDLRIRLCP
jgi:hypothetical protein